VVGFYAVFFMLAGVGFAADAGRGPAAIESIVPSFIAVDRPYLSVLTKELRVKVSSLGLNGSKGADGEKISRALALFAPDRAKAGVLSFEIETGSAPGVYQCEALGRGATSREPKAGWMSGLIGGATIYYASADMDSGATVPGIYDLRNITPDRYQIVFLDKPETMKDGNEIPARAANADGSPKPFFSAVWKHWYTKTNLAVPVDMIWAADYNQASEKAGIKIFERLPKAETPEAQARQAAQLAHSPLYYTGPYGRSGWAVHTDLWEDPARRLDPRHAGRPELMDFRFRDTSGCVKVRPGCLLLLNEFIAEQERLGRRAQLEVRETPLVDKVEEGISLPGARFNGSAVVKAKSKRFFFQPLNR
jgi:hypothetical protein